LFIFVKNVYYFGYDDDDDKNNNDIIIIIKCTVYSVYDIPYVV